MGAGRVLCADDYSTGIPLSLHSVSFAEAACVELVMNDPVEEAALPCAGGKL